MTGVTSSTDDFLWTHAARHIAIGASSAAREDRRWRFYSEHAGCWLSGVPVRQWELECVLANAWAKQNAFPAPAQEPCASALPLERIQ